ncbi:serine/threonine-protein kinase [Corallococcus exiguus]|uniref:Protein kinase n=1 Tax=Corallococcus exiguus TaxID=83462 RepID=A0A7X4YIB8_9BACT|nr:serine/threonine-protein kinase [Corallococcus exiguus]NBC44922.1 protein kinase [Corallococcus exiguus]TNV61905.1 serine/threonine protein kinase [Corallococcus exiguus]
MKTPDTTTEENPGMPRRPRVLFTVGGTAFEFVRKLEVRSTGELLMLARRRYRGGMGGPVVIKRLRNPSGFVERRRLVEEVELTFRLNHPGIAKVYHLKAYRGVPHVVMEYVEGRSLDTVLNLVAMRRKPMSPAFGAWVVSEVAEALHHAHTLRDEWNRPLGIVHRDVSPRNLRLGVHGEVKLTNFTAAFSTLPGREITSRPLVKGDVAYASPEALRREPLDARSDLFSLGLVLLEVLTGTHPLAQGDTAPPPPPDLPLVQAQGPTWMPLTEVAARMALVGPGEVELMARDVPEGLRAVVVRALRQAPADRFGTAAELASALREWLREHAPAYGRQSAAEEVAEAAREATGRRNQAELLEGGLHPEELTAEEAAMASEATVSEGPPPFLGGDDVTPDLNDEPLPLQDLDLVEDLDELAGPDEEAQGDDFEDDDDGHQPV